MKKFISIALVAAFFLGSSFVRSNAGGGFGGGFAGGLTGGIVAGALMQPRGSSETVVYQPAPQPQYQPQYQQPYDYDDRGYYNRKRRYEPSYDDDRDYKRRKYEDLGQQNANLKRKLDEQAEQLDELRNEIRALKRQKTK